VTPRQCQPVSRCVSGDQQMVHEHWKSITHAEIVFPVHCLRPQT